MFDKRRNIEEHGMRNAEQSHSLAHTHNQISGNLVMKDENNLITLRFDDNKFDIKRNQIAKFLKTFQKKSPSKHSTWQVGGYHHLALRLVLPDCGQ